MPPHPDRVRRNYRVQSRPTVWEIARVVIYVVLISVGGAHVAIWIARLFR